MENVNKMMVCSEVAEDIWTIYVLNIDKIKLEFFLIFHYIQKSKFKIKILTNPYPCNAVLGLLISKQ